MSKESNNPDRLMSIDSAAGMVLQPARLDLQSVKVQMVLGLLLILGACLTAYWTTLPVGFLLDDFLHLDYVSRAVSGDWQDFARNFYSNWGGSNLMQAYRPVTSVSLLLDYALYGINAVGFHLTNILLLFACCALVSLITLEITGLCGNRLGATPAIWAGLLFAVYPLHPESVAWITGRVDLLCALFFLASVFSYLRFRLVREPIYLWCSLIACFLSLISKEMAVVLPVVITLAEVCLWSRLNQKSAQILGQTHKSNRIGYVMAFWAILGMYMTLRVAVLGTAIGGYNAPDLLTSLRNFLDKATLFKIVVPANEEVVFPAWIKPALICSSVGAAVILAGRLAFRSCLPGPYLWLLLWTLAAILPTYQIWHVYPNLVGSRLFFLASAPFCMLLSLAVLPAVDALPKPLSRAVTILGLLMLLVTYACWSVVVSGNLKPWQTAGVQMRDMRSQIQKLVKQTVAGKKILLLNLPSDYSGAGMLARGQYLNFIASPPLSVPGFAERLLSLEPLVGGSHDYMWTGQFHSMLAHHEVGQAFTWSPSEGKFLDWKPASGLDNYAVSVSDIPAAAVGFIPAQTTITDSDKWSVRSAQTPVVERHSDFWRIYPGASGLELWFPASHINPLSATVAVIDMSAEASSAGKVRIVWGDVPGQKAVINDLHGQHTAWLGRYRAWSLYGPVTKIGLRFEPGDYSVDFRGLKIGAAKTLLPVLQIVGLESLDAGQLGLHKVSGKNLVLRYDAQAITDAAGVKLLISPLSTTFDANAEADVDAVIPVANQRLPFSEIVLKNLWGTIDLSSRLSGLSGVHQARLMVLNSAGQEIALPSEPVSFELP